MKNQKGDSTAQIREDDVQLPSGKTPPWGWLAYVLKGKARDLPGWERMMMMVERALLFCATVLVCSGAPWYAWGGVLVAAAIYPHFAFLGERSEAKMVAIKARARPRATKRVKVGLKRPASRRAQQSGVATSGSD